MKLQDTSFISKLRDASYELNLKQQFSKKIAESNYETAKCWNILRAELLNFMLSKLLETTGN